MPSSPITMCRFLQCRQADQPVSLHTISPNRRQVKPVWSVFIGSPGCIRADREIWVLDHSDPARMHGRGYSPGQRSPDPGIGEPQPGQAGRDCQRAGKTPAGPVFLDEAERCATAGLMHHGDAAIGAASAVPGAAHPRSRGTISRKNGQVFLKFFNVAHTPFS
jgi:hypothetical protein